MNELITTLTRKEYEKWIERHDEYFKFFGIDPFSATFKSQQIRQMNERTQALKTLDMEYLADHLETAATSHYWWIGNSGF